MNYKFRCLDCNCLNCQGRACMSCGSRRLVKDEPKQKKDEKQERAKKIEHDNRHFAKDHQS